MKLRIDRDVDALYLRLADTKIIESEQVGPGIIVDFDAKNRVVGVEVLNVSKRTSKAKVRKRSSSATSRPVFVRENPTKRYGK